jgi:integrase
MNNELKPEHKQYIDFKVYSVTTIKSKYGFRIVLIYEDGTKKVMQKAGYKTKKEATNARDVIVTELHNNTFVVNNSIDVKTYFTDWLEIVMKPNYLTADSYDAYKNVVYNHIIPELGRIKMTELNKGHIQDFYNKKVKYSHNIARLCKAVFNSAFKYAVEKKFINNNIAEGVNLPKCVKKKKYRTIEIDSKKTLNEKQLELLIEKSKDSPIYMQILFASLMGLRKQEINGLKYSDIDYIHRTIKIQRQLGRKPNTDNSELKKGEYTKQEIDVKTFSSKRELEIPDLVFEAILEERKKYEKNRSRRINDKSNPFKDLDYICCSTYGNPRSKSFHFKYWKQLLKDNDLPDIRFHDLRATYCTLLLKNNFSSKAVSKMMGHATDIISVDVYGDNEEIISDCLNELEPFIELVIPKEEDNDGDELLYDIGENYINELMN